MPTKILIIGGNHAEGDNVSNALREAGYLLKVTDTAENAVSIMRRDAPDIVLTDLELTGMKGDELALRYAYDYTVSVILIVDPENAPTCDPDINKGVADFLVTPFTADEMIKRVHRAEELLKMLRTRERLVSELERMSNVDELTGLFNARQFTKRYRSEIMRAQEDGTDLSLMMIDLDHFKRLNDTLGHEVGNDVLGAVGKVLQASIQNSDSAFRYGGEEFVILLPGTVKAQAAERAELLRQQIQRLGQEQFSGSPITASIGVAQFESGEEGDAFVNRADAAMYVGKQEGRNRVIEA